jgi:hypothetical protein
MKSLIEGKRPKVEGMDLVKSWLEPNKKPKEAPKKKFYAHEEDDVEEEVIVQLQLGRNFNEISLTCRSNGR